MITEILHAFSNDKKDVIRIVKGGGYYHINFQSKLHIIRIGID